jgi:hypothetical protein
VAEAVVAAQALTPDLEQQVEITAGLIGLTPDAVRPFVLEAPPLSLQRSAAPQRGYTRMDVGRRPPGPVVVVERRSRLAGHDLVGAAACSGAGALTVMPMSGPTPAFRSC